jgi:DNA replication protein DnaC
MTQQNCNECTNGLLPDKVHYYALDLVGQAYCTCDAGNGAFQEWCKTKVVQNAIKTKQIQQIDKLLQDSELPLRWQQKTLDKLEGQEQLKQTIHRYVDNFSQYQKEGRGIYLWSNGSGRGKTHAISSVCKMLIYQYVVPCLFINEELLFAKLQETFSSSKKDETPLLQKFRTVKCLFLDDFGATKITAWKNEVMTGILDYRLNHSLPTFFTSNYSLHDYTKLLKNSCVALRPERISSRIAEICRGFIFEVRGEDWRKKVSIQP